jgi:uncharacterized membrane-anchored protein
VTVLPGKDDVPNMKIFPRAISTAIRCGFGIASGRNGRSGFPHPRRRFQPRPGGGRQFHAAPVGPRGSRLFEIDIYRMLALLALPVAAELRPFLAETEEELVQVTSALVTVKDEEETALLKRLTVLEAAIETRRANNHFRFSASAAYHELMRRRIEDLREQRIQGLQTIPGIHRTLLVPAMNTCQAMAARQETVSERIRARPGCLHAR